MSSIINQSAQSLIEIEAKKSALEQKKKMLLEKQGKKEEPQPQKTEQQKIEEAFDENLKKLDARFEKMFQKTDGVLELVSAKDNANFLFPKEIKEFQKSMQKQVSSENKDLISISKIEDFKTSIRDIGFVCEKASVSLEQVNLEMLRIQQCLNPSVQADAKSSEMNGNNDSASNQSRHLNYRQLETTNVNSNAFEEENKEEIKRIKFLDRVLTNLDGHISTINSAMNAARKNEKYIPQNLKDIYQNMQSNCYDNFNLERRIQSRHSELACKESVQAAANTISEILTKQFSEVRAVSNGIDQRITEKCLRQDFLLQTRSSPLRKSSNRSASSKPHLGMDFDLDGDNDSDSSDEGITPGLGITANKLGYQSEQPVEYPLNEHHLRNYQLYLNEMNNNNNASQSNLRVDRKFSEFEDDATMPKKKQEKKKLAVEFDLDGSFDGTSQENSESSVGDDYNKKMKQISSESIIRRVSSEISQEQSGGCDMNSQEDFQSPLRFGQNQQLPLSHQKKHQQQQQGSSLATGEGGITVVGGSQAAITGTIKQVRREEDVILWKIGQNSISNSEVGSLAGGSLQWQQKHANMKQRERQFENLARVFGQEIPSQQHQKTAKQQQLKTSHVATAAATTHEKGVIQTIPCLIKVNKLTPMQYEKLLVEIKESEEKILKQAQAAVAAAAAQAKAQEQAKAAAIAQAQAQAAAAEAAKKKAAAENLMKQQQLAATSQAAAAAAAAGGVKKQEPVARAPAQQQLQVPGGVGGGRGVAPIQQSIQLSAVGNPLNGSGSSDNEFDNDELGDEEEDEDEDQVGDLRNLALNPFMREGANPNAGGAPAPKKTQSIGEMSAMKPSAQTRIPTGTAAAGLNRMMFSDALGTAPATSTEKVLTNERAAQISSEFSTATQKPAISTKIPGLGAAIPRDEPKLPPQIAASIKQGMQVASSAGIPPEEPKITQQQAAAINKGLLAAGGAAMPRDEPKLSAQQAAAINKGVLAAAAGSGGVSAAMPPDEPKISKEKAAKLTAEMNAASGQNSKPVAAAAAAAASSGTGIALGGLLGPLAASGANQQNSLFQPQGNKTQTTSLFGEPKTSGLLGQTVPAQNITSVAATTLNPISGAASISDAPSKKKRQQDNESTTAASQSVSAGPTSSIFATSQQQPQMGSLFQPAPGSQGSGIGQPNKIGGAAATTTAVGGSGLFPNSLGNNNNNSMFAQGGASQQPAQAQQSANSSSFGNIGFGQLNAGGGLGFVSQSTTGGANSGNLFNMGANSNSSGGNMFGFNSNNGGNLNAFATTSQSQPSGIAALTQPAQALNVGSGFNTAQFGGSQFGTQSTFGAQNQQNKPAFQSNIAQISFGFVAGSATAAAAAGGQGTNAQPQNNTQQPGGIFSNFMPNNNAGGLFGGGQAPQMQSTVVPTGGNSALYQMRK